MSKTSISVSVIYIGILQTVKYPKNPDSTKELGQALTLPDTKPQGLACVNQEVPPGSKGSRLGVLLLW